MFEITSLTLWSFENESFVYRFSAGVNYIEGANDTGKTAFFEFIDFMLGHEDKNLSKIPWLNHISHAEMLMKLHDQECLLVRSLDGQKNEVRVNGTTQRVYDLADYRETLNSFICPSQSAIEEFWEYVDSEISYRTFTLFNFLGENQQGRMHAFFGRLDELKYRVKERVVFDFIFNKDPRRVIELERSVKQLSLEQKVLSQRAEENDSMSAEINQGLSCLGAPITFNGENINDVREFISAYDVASDSYKNRRKDELAASVEGAAVLADQIKTLDEMSAESSLVEKQNERRIALLHSLNEVIRDRPEYRELLEPTQKLLQDLKETVSLKSLKIHKDILGKKKKQLEKVKGDLDRSEAIMKPLDLDQKVKTAILVSEYLRHYNEDDIEAKLKSLNDKLREYKQLLNQARWNNDESRVAKVSETITSYYKLAESLSSFVTEDFRHEGFRVDYVKEGNALQPMYIVEDQDSECYTGSKARHTLLQLCGYCAFLKMLVSSKRYPISPLLIIDHISASFDDENRNGIGAILNGFVEDMELNSVQIFLFDSASPEALSIRPNRHIKLAGRGKTGFNPFISLNRPLAG